MSTYRLVITATLLAAFLASTSCSKKKASDASNDIGKSENHYIAVKKKGQQLWSILDYDSGKIIKEEEYRMDEVPSIIQGEVFFIKEKDGFNYYNIKDLKHPLNDSPFLYASIFDNKSKRALVVTQEGKICIIDKKGNIKVTLPDEISSASRFINGYSVVSDNDKRKGVINASGMYVIRPQYDVISEPSADGCVVATKEVEHPYNEYETYYEFVTIKLNDSSSETLFTFNSNQYQDYGVFYNGYLPVEKDDNVVLLDSKGNEVAIIGKGIYDYDNGNAYNISLIRVIDNKVQTYNKGVYGLKNINTGETLIRNKYEYLIPVGKDRYIAKRADGKYGIVNSNDETINNRFDKTMIAPLPESDNLIVLESTSDDIDDDITFDDLSYKTYITDNNLKCKKDTIYVKGLSMNLGQSYLPNLYFDINKNVNLIMAKITPQSFLGFRKDVKRNTISTLWSVDNEWDRRIRSVDGITTVEHRKYFQHQRDFDYTLLFSEMESRDNVQRVTFGVKYGIITLNVRSKILGIERELYSRLGRELTKKGFTYTDENGTFVNYNNGTSVTLTYCSNGDFHIIYDFDIYKETSIKIDEIYIEGERERIIMNNELDAGIYLPHDNNEGLLIIDINNNYNNGSAPSRNSSSPSPNPSYYNESYAVGQFFMGIVGLWLLSEIFF